MRLSAKFSILISLLIVVLSFSAGTLLYLGEKNHLDKQLAVEQLSLIKAFSQSASDMFLTGDELAMINYSKILLDNPAISEVSFYDFEGRIIANSSVDNIGSFFTPPLIYKTQNQHGLIKEYFKSGGEVYFSITNEVRNSGKLLGSARIVFSENQILSRIHSALFSAAKRIAVVFLIIILLGIFGAWLISKTVTQPIKKIAGATRLIAQNKLEHRLDINSSDELGELASDFNLMAERLGEVDKMKREFVSNVTHELRSPLSAIESYSNLMIENVASNKLENAVDYLAIIRNNSIRLGRFITDLLDISKIEAKKLSIDKSAQNLNSIAAEIIDLFRAKILNDNISLITKFASEADHVMLDADKIRQVITNLMSNALKFTPQNGKITLATSMSSDQNGIEFIISDSGPGIPKEELNKIFDKFEQVKETRQNARGAKGTGLGLAISRSIIEGHGGKLWAESVFGDGSSFHFTLPARLGQNYGK